MKSTKMILAAAMTGLLAGAAARASTPAIPSGSSQPVIKKMTTDSSKAGVRLADDKDTKGKHDCKGKNDCKGEGGCKSGDNGCKGKNTCKGHGGCKTNGEKKA